MTMIQMIHLMDGIFLENKFGYIIINNTRAIERLQRTQKKEGDDDSSDDSLDGWDIRP